MEILETAWAHDSARLVQEAMSGLLLTLLRRAFQHAESAVVVFVTTGTSAAEILGRGAIELCASIIYILGGNRAERLVAYFEHYLGELERNLRKWQTAVQGEADHDRAVHLRAIHYRQEYLRMMRGVVSDLRNACGENEHHAAWPTIAQRFQAIGREVDYRTIYARLSSQVHSDAEDVLSDLVFRCVGDEAMREKATGEAYQFSRMIVVTSARWCVLAAGSYGAGFILPEVPTHLQAALEELDQELQHISTLVGAPDLSG
jgi:hypothetical protein